MLKQSFVKIARELAVSGTFRTNNFYGAITVVAESSFFAIGFWLLVQSPRFSIIYWILEFLLGLSLFRFFVLLHECGHKTLFHKKYANTIVGTLISTLCIIPYIPWRNVHYQHHRWVGVVDKDPTQAILLKFKNSSSFTKHLFRLIWKTWFPISFFKLIFQVFWLYPLEQWQKGNRKVAKASFASVVAIVIIQTLFIGFLGIGEYFTLYGPMLLIYAIWFENMNFSQHVGLFPYLSSHHPQPIPLYEQDAISRTSQIHPLLAVLCTYNFNLHIEHHFFPSIPWYYLPRVKRAILGAQNLDYKGVEFPNFILELRQQDPIDIYVNSLPPHNDGQQ